MTNVMDDVSQLAQILQLANSPSNEIQQQIQAKLQELAPNPQYKTYLLAVFIGKYDCVVRQRAGLLLKNSLMHDWPKDPHLLENIKRQTLETTKDCSKAVRDTGGTVLTVIIQRIGITSWPEALEVLTRNLDCGQVDIVDGSFSALSKICEDFIEQWIIEYEATKDIGTPPFMNFVTQTLFPKIFAMATLQSPPVVRKYCLEMLNHFAINRIFDTQHYDERPHLFIDPYVQVVCSFAKDTETDVLKEVCRGFMYLVNHHHAKLQSSIDPLINYMLEYSAHSDENIRIQAIEFWTSAANINDFTVSIRNILDRLIPVLLMNMRYSASDYMAMSITNQTNDDSKVPDRKEDLPPQFHKTNEKDDDDNESTSGPWGGVWTARKAAATVLDYFSSQFYDIILPIVLPLINERLESKNDWEAQESGVLAVGAIAFGCWQGISQYLPTVINMLVEHSKSEQPLLRSICCWCISRFSEWICSENNPDRVEVLRKSLAAILQRVLDKNKRVQEAACSAFATLEEEARYHLIPFLGDIVDTLQEAFKLYQQNNLLHLYDACGTLAEAVGSALNKPEFQWRFLGPLIHRMENTADSDPAMLTLFPCLTTCARRLQDGFFSCCSSVVDRCGSIVEQRCLASRAWKQNPGIEMKPEMDIMACALDLLAGIVEGLGSKLQDVLRERNFVVILVATVKEDNVAVKQSSFALMGDCAKHCTQQLIPLLPTLIPECATGLVHMCPGVSNNASWAIGEVCVVVTADVMRPYLEMVVSNLLKQLRQAKVTQRTLLTQNICITLGRLGCVCAADMAGALSQIIEPWCIVMEQYRQDPEKITAFQGFCNILQNADANTQTNEKNVVHILHAIASFKPGTQNGPSLHGRFQQIINGYRRHFGDRWPQLVSQLKTNYQQHINQYLAC